MNDKPYIRHYWGHIKGNDYNFIDSIVVTPTNPEPKVLPRGFIRWLTPYSTVTIRDDGMHISPRYPQNEVVIE